MTVADAQTLWGGMTIGIVAAALFVVFSAWVVVQRIRGNRKDHHD